MPALLVMLGASGRHDDPVLLHDQHRRAEQRHDPRVKRRAAQDVEEHRLLQQCPRLAGFADRGRQRIGEDGEAVARQFFQRLRQDRVGHAGCGLGDTVGFHRGTTSSQHSTSSPCAPKRAARPACAPGRSANKI